VRPQRDKTPVGDLPWSHRKDKRRRRVYNVDARLPAGVDSMQRDAAVQSLLLPELHYRVGQHDADEDVRQAVERRRQ
jgi:hypothetical protein